MHFTPLQYIWHHCYTFSKGKQNNFSRKLFGRSRLPVKCNILNLNEMFAVIQFIENTKFQVLAVPVSWIKNGNLLWPKLSNEKIEHLRVSGAEYHGAFKRIPVIITKKFRNFEAAEKAADDLAKRDVSDVEEKRKKLKPQKKPPLKKPKDYNAMLSGKKS